MNLRASAVWRRRRIPLAIANAAVVLLAMGLLMQTGPRLSPSERAAMPVSGGTDAFKDSAAPSNTTSARELVRPQGGFSSELGQTIQETQRRLLAENDPEKKRLLVEELKQQVISGGSKEGASAAILEFLRSGEDAPTGLAFRVGSMHALAEAPTLRTALLDWLGQLDPAAAADCALSIFGAMTSPEEYAMALRNFARGRPRQREELRHHFNRLLAHLPWAEKPTAGYLESFDVVPHLADPAFLRQLSALLSPPTHASIRHASLVALDRLILANPAAACAELLDGQAVSHQPLIRASFVARADIRDPIQRGLVERYLLLESVTDRELEKFVRLFPNANRFLSQNLLTESGGRSLAELAGLDAAALKQVRQWQTEPQFMRSQPRLKQLESRLQEQVDSAIRAGYLPPK